MDPSPHFGALRARGLSFHSREKAVCTCIGFSMTINKSQGQGANVVGIDLRVPCFSHGQLYVACSWVTSRQGLERYYCQKVLCRPLLMLYGKMPFSNPDKCDVNIFFFILNVTYFVYLLLHSIVTIPHGPIFAHAASCIHLATKEYWDWKEKH